MTNKLDKKNLNPDKTNQIKFFIIFIYITLVSFFINSTPNNTTGMQSDESSIGNKPVIISVSMGRPNSPDGTGTPTWYIVPLNVEFQDTDRNLKGGWLEITTYGYTGYTFKIELQYQVFDNFNGSCTFKPILNSNIHKITIRLIDSKGLPSDPVEIIPSFANPELGRYLLSSVALYDDFDGNGSKQQYNNVNLSIMGSPSFDLWAISANNRNDVQIVKAENLNPIFAKHGYVAKIFHGKRWRDAVRMYMISPRFYIKYSDYKPSETRTAISFINFQSLSADIMVSSKSTSQDFIAGVEILIGFDQPTYAARYRSWRLGVTKNPDDGNYYACAQYFNTHFPEQNHTEILEKVNPDNWNNFRIESQQASNIELKISFYVNNIFKTAWTPQEGNLLINMPEKNLWFGPARNLMIYKPEPDGTAIAYFDNVYGVYENRSE